MQKLNKKIIEWAKEREIDKKATCQAQLVKTYEEIAELVKAICKNNIEDIIDSIGDVYVTIIIGNMLLKNDIREIPENLSDSIEEVVNLIKFKSYEMTRRIVICGNFSRLCITPGESEDKLRYKRFTEDVMNNLMMICGVYDLDLKNCIQSAYDVISNRQGKMVDGMFIKKEDLI